jgi:hypothetical protein
MKKIYILLLLLPFGSFAQQDDAAVIKKISDEILKNGKAYDLLYQLTKQVGGRIAGSPQMYKAEAWGEKALKEMGADKVWLQECMVPRWVRGAKEDARVVTIDGKKTNRVLDVLALGNSMGSAKPITAEVIAFDSFEEMEKRKDAVKGKIVYFNHSFDPTNIKPFVSYGQTGVSRRAGPSLAAKYGAVGVMIRSLTESTANDPHTGGTVYNDSFPKIPAIAMGPRDADYIWDLSKKSSFTVTMKTSAKFLPDTIGHNVIGELRGSMFPDEIITVGGHLDSWDVNEGAHDDGAGVVHTIEVMRALKAIGYQPKRTIRFVLFANEENGMRGGNKYAAEAKEKGEKHIFALESDAGGFTPRGFGFTAPKDKHDKMQAWLPLLKPYGTEDMSGSGGGADIGPLNRTFGTPIAGFIPDPQRYFDLHHARTDVFENVNKRELLLGAVNMAALIYLVDKYGL